MCGIVGYTKTPSLKNLSVDTNKLIESIRHRGPDEQRFYDDDSVFLGHTRLSIVDIKDGHQPFTYKNYVMVFNGEIYNHNALRVKLEALGHTFLTRSDTEVLLHMFAEFGPECTSQLNGMFAYAVFNKQTKQISIGRDYFGIKPLYYYTDDKGGLYFSSEIISLIGLLKQNKIKINLSEESQREFLGNGSISKNPVFTGLVEFPKGSVVTFDEQGLEISHFTQKYTIDADESRDLDSVLKDEVALQIDADVDVGVFLSGGIDSSLLTSIYRELKPEKAIHSFSIIYNDKTCDESSASRKVSKLCNTNHHEFLFDESIFLEYFPKLIETLDSPIADPAMIPMLYLSAETKKHCKVVLSGDGGDELFAGYTHHRVIKYRPLFQLALKLLKISGLAKGLQNTLSSLLSSFTKSFTDQLKYDLNEGLNLRLLRKTDLCSMRFGVEVRVPFLTENVYSWAKKRPASGFVNLLYGKRPLRQLVRRYIDREIAYKKKKGFRLPLAQWMAQGEFADFLQNELVNERVINEAVVSQHTIKTYLSDRRKYTNQLFSLLILNLWIKKIKSL